MSYFDILCYCLTKKKLFVFPVLTAILCFVLAWVFPPIYTTELRLQVDASTSESSTLGGVSSMFKSSMGALSQSSLASVLGGQNVVKPSDLYLEILSGREVALNTIHKFRLDTLYKKKADELTLKRFYKDVAIGEDASGIISCAFEAKDKVMARDIVRHMVKISNERYLSLQRERLQYSIEYLKNQERELMDSVQSISDELIAFYRDNNLVDLNSQMEITVKALAGYETQINNYKLSEQMQGKDNADKNETRKKRQLLEKKFRELRGRYDSSYVPTDRSLYVNSDWASEKILYQERRASDLKRFQTLLEFISTEKMNTESQNLKNQPVIQIIQDAYLPDWKTRPKRAKWAIAGFIASFMATLFFVVYRGVSTGAIVGSEGARRKLELIKSSLHK
ncbi:hypothetical protein [Fibrobacter sp.]|uniref:hypothetical protein n=1 Tax=Fibrobacter sp. TaxID=35828 RepID=UPI0038911835